MGAYFYLFSIYQRPDDEDEDQFDERDITPLLRFSTPSKAQHENWIKAVADTCEFSETPEYAAAEAARARDRLAQEREQINMVQAMPGVKRGTLPPLYFGTATTANNTQPSLKRTRSLNKVNSGSRPKLFRTRSKEFNADQLEAKSTKGYPPSKPSKCSVTSLL